MPVDAPRFEYDQLILLSETHTTFASVDLIFFIFSALQNVPVRETEARANALAAWMYAAVGGALPYNTVLVVTTGLKYVLNKLSLYRIDGSASGLGVNCPIWAYYAQ